jgi:hypothetical protein
MECISRRARVLTLCAEPAVEVVGIEVAKLASAHPSRDAGLGDRRVVRHRRGGPVGQPIGEPVADGFDDGVFRGRDGYVVVVVAQQFSELVLASVLLVSLALRVILLPRASKPVEIDPWHRTRWRWRSGVPVLVQVSFERLRGRS